MSRRLRRSLLVGRRRGEPLAAHKLCHCAAVCVPEAQIWMGSPATASLWRAARTLRGCSRETSVVRSLTWPRQNKLNNMLGAPAIDREAGPGQTQESKALELKGLGMGGNVIRHKGAMFDRHGERRAREIGKKTDDAATVRSREIETEKRRANAR